MTWGWLMRQLHCYNCGLAHKNPESFIRSKCGLKKCFPVWTVCWAIVHMAVLALDVYHWHDNEDQPPERWFVYPFRWNYCFITLTAVLNFMFTTWIHMLNRSLLRGDEDYLPWYLKLTWLLTNCWSTGSFVAAIAFFVELDSPHYSEIVLIGVSMAYSVIDIFVTARPIKIFHVYQPMIYACVFAVITYADQWTGSKPVYDFIDWSNLIDTLIIFVPIILTAIPFIHLLLFGLYLVRSAIPEYKSTKSTFDLGNGGVHYAVGNETLHF